METFQPDIPYPKCLHICWILGNFQIGKIVARAFKPFVWLLVDFQTVLNFNMPTNNPS